jgi:hypothetical protein
MNSEQDPFTERNLALADAVRPLFSVAIRRLLSMKGQITNSDLQELRFLAAECTITATAPNYDQTHPLRSA